MPVKSAQFSLSTSRKHEVVDITAQVRELCERLRSTDNALCHVFTPHATAAITINENDDPNIGEDLQTALRKSVVEHDGWLHDKVDNNAAAHIKAAILGPSEAIPIVEGKLALGTWQNVFLCEFDGPRQTRRIIVSVVS